MRRIGEERCIVKPGNHALLGVTAIGKMTNFAVAVPCATEVILNIYHGDAKEPSYAIVMEETERDGDVFAICVSERATDATYCYEVNGKAFVDPYAKLVLGRNEFGRAVLSHVGIRAALYPHSYSWKGEVRPRIPLHQVVLYELHVRGFSMKDGGAYAGTYAGVAAKVNYLQTLGVNAVLLMPCMEFAECGEIDAEGITGEGERQARDFKVNYWGYASEYYYFAPKASYAATPERADTEFKAMVRKLHNNGIEVMLEIYIPENANRNILPEALRYWVREYHIDGFRINLEAIDAKMLAQDPYLSHTKILGAGWDVRRIYPKGCRPTVPHLLECNGEYATVVRQFLKGTEGFTREFARQILESGADFSRANYIADHNGFTLADLYTYEKKQNDANGERGRDGVEYNFGWNCGVEGPTNKLKIRRMRLRMRKNAFLTLLISQGVPLLRAGDEFGNSQYGNNNAYCQDNEIGWLDTKNVRRDKEFFEFVKEALTIRKAHPVLRNPAGIRREDYLFCGTPDASVHGCEAWIPDESPYSRSIGILLHGEFAKTDDGTSDDSLYLMFNMQEDEQWFAVPMAPNNCRWRVLITTGEEGEIVYDGGQRIRIPSRTIAILIGDTMK